MISKLYFIMVFIMQIILAQALHIDDLLGKNNPKPPKSVLNTHELYDFYDECTDSQRRFFDLWCGGVKSLHKDSKEIIPTYFGHGFGNSFVEEITIKHLTIHQGLVKWSGNKRTIDYDFYNVPIRTYVAYHLETDISGLSSIERGIPVILSDEAQKTLMSEEMRHYKDKRLKSLNIYVQAKEFCEIVGVPSESNFTYNEYKMNYFYGLMLTPASYTNRGLFVEKILLKPPKDVPNVIQENNAEMMSYFGQGFNRLIKVKCYLEIIKYSSNKDEFEAKIYKIDPSHPNKKDSQSIDVKISIFSEFKSAVDSENDTISSGVYTFIGVECYSFVFDNHTLKKDPQLYFSIYQMYKDEMPLLEH